MSDNMLRLPEVIGRTGLSKATIYRYTKLEQFPQSYQLTPRCVAWKESEISAYIDNLSMTV